MRRLLNWCHVLAGRADRLIVWIIFTPFIFSPAWCQNISLLTPESVIEIWDFNQISENNQINGLVQGYGVNLYGDSKLSPPSSGRTGSINDHALDFGSNGSSQNPTHAKIDAISNMGTQFLEKLNAANQFDKLSIVFWQQWNTSQVTNSSTVWFSSPSSSSGERGLQAHLPWGNNIIYFDTSGCCSSPENRLNGSASSISPPINWNQWNHIALIKNGPAKQVWINGKLFLNQTSGALPLKNDCQSVFLGQSPTEPEIAFHGKIDDLALFSLPLSQDQITLLAGGANPSELLVPQDQWPPIISSVTPINGQSFHPSSRGISFKVSTSEPNAIAPSSIQLFLNEINVSSDLSIEGSSTQWSASYNSPLQQNDQFVARIHVTDNTGNNSEYQWSFDTLLGNQTPTIGAISLKDKATPIENIPNINSNPMNGIDADLDTIYESVNQEGSFYILTLDQAYPIHQLELINRQGNLSTRMNGILIELIDEENSTISSTIVTSAMSGEKFSFSPQTDKLTSKIKLSLPPGEKNMAGDYIISFADLIVMTSPNLAQDAESYMMRFNESLPPTKNGNDGLYSTFTESTPQAVGSYFEVDLQEEKALYQVRVVAADGFQSRMSHTTVRLYDADHSSVFSQHLTGRSSVYDVFTPGPVFARYLRVGFENKERSEPGTFWHLGLKELQAFGLNVHEVGLTAFNTSQINLPQGQTSTLFWTQKDLRSLYLYPDSISMLPHTDADGSGNYFVSPTQSTEYILIGKSHNELHIKHLAITVDNQLIPIHISEFVAQNNLSLEGEFENSPDWIEIHNPNNVPVNISGYGLSDDPAIPLKWTFPENTILTPHEYLIVLASGENTPNNEGSFLHTNFSLNADGESLILSTPNAASIADQILSFPPQTEDLAFGRSLSGNWTFLEPTPHSANHSQTYTGWLEPINFSHSRGFIDDSFLLQLNHPDPEATIQYSLNGGSTYSPYADPIFISGPVACRAQVIRDGFKSPREQTHTYISIEGTLKSNLLNSSLINDPSISAKARQGLIDLPIFSISVPQLPDDYNEHPASIEIFLPHHPPLQINAGITRFGGAWTEFAKKNYRLKFRKEYGHKKLDAPLFNGFDHGFLSVEKFDELDLRAGGHDMSSRGFYLSNRFAEDSMLDMGSLNPHGRFVHLFINGQYWGQYHLRERLTSAFLADYLGGASHDYTEVRGNDNAGSNFVPGTPDPVNREPWLNVLNNKGNYNSLKEWIDVPHLIDFMIMWNFGNAETEFRSAGPIQPGSGFKFWLGDGDGFIRTSSDRTSNPGPGDIFGSLVSEADPDFLILLADRIHKHLFNDGALTKNANIKRLTNRWLEIQNSLLLECARWGYRTPENWEAAYTNALSDIFSSQTDVLISRLTNRGLYPTTPAPVLGQENSHLPDSSSLTISTTSGDIYYTLDGSDPRLNDGSISPSAIHLSNLSQQKISSENAVWNYLDTNVPPPDNWTSSISKPLGWKSGSAPLGYGDSGLPTTLDFGMESLNKYPTVYFHQIFNLSELPTQPNLTLNFIRDDGVAIYLNGNEIARDNLPDGPLTFNTLALSAVGGLDESSIISRTIPSSILNLENNVLAAEVHQSSTSSSDLRFNAWISTSLSHSVIINSSATIKARTYSNSNWSALTETFLVNQITREPIPGDLLFSEIHFNPLGSDEYEFLEIFNTSNSTLNLSGAELRGGIDFIFPSPTILEKNQILVVVENIEAFGSRYQSPNTPHFYPDIHVAGAWSGKLSNEGDIINLLNSSGTQLISFEYQTNSNWPAQSQGLGSSIELLPPFLAPPNQINNPTYFNNPDLWSPSTILHGSPGRLQILPIPIPQISMSLNQSTLDIKLNFNLPPGFTFVLESTSTLFSPSWTPIQSWTPASQSPISLTITPESSLPHIFYRLRYQ